MKKQNGITLIALVITIIVLLILAGITITAILGDNGILGKSEKAKLKTEQAAILEELRLKAYDKKTEDINNEMLNIDYLKDAGYIKEEFTQAENTCYAINPNRLNPVPVTGKGTVDDGDIYYLLNGTLYYKQTNDEDTEIGPVFKENYAAVVPPEGVSDVEWIYNETPEGDIEVTGFNLGIDDWGTFYEAHGPYITIDCPILYIPSKIEGKRVVRVSFDGYPAHGYGSSYPKRLSVSGINKIIYPDTVEEIGGSRIIFPDVMEVSLPSNLVKICSSAFRMPNIEKIEIPETVKIIESNALRSCFDLKQINLPEELETLGSDVFSYCYSLESITIPKNITEIPYDSFSGCHSLKNVTFLGDVTIIGNSAFSGCSSLENISIPSSVTSIYSYAFSGCIKLKEITIPTGVTNIEERTFSGCTELKKLTIPANVTAIGEGAFSRCTGLTEIIISENVTEIGEYAFSGCSSLETINVESDNPKYDSRDNCNAIIETGTNTLKFGFKSTVIPLSVTSIENNAFYNCTTLKNITIPSNIVNIGDDAFYNCSALTNIIISNGVERIGESVFTNCILLTNIIIPESVTEIGTKAFNDCSSLTDIYIKKPEGSIPGAPWYGWWTDTEAIVTWNYTD